MKVRLMPADDAGCGYYRMREPARIAEREGVEVELAEAIPRVELSGAGELDGLIVPDALDADVIVFQRPVKGPLVDLMPHLQERGHTVVVDVDDDFSCIHPQHPAFDQFHPTRKNTEVSHHHLMRACGMADMVTVTTPSLADRYGSHGRVAVLPNCVPEAMLDMPYLGDGLTLGWGGAHHMHPGDLEVTHHGIREVLDRTGWKFRVIGRGEGVSEKLGLDSVEATGWLTLEGYQMGIGSLDVAIVPLGESRFNDGKSYLKGIEYAARGVPFVASPVPSYVQLANEGIGAIAAPRGRTWRGVIERYINAPERRREASHAGREAVAARHTYEGEGWKWCEAWEFARARRMART